MAVPADDNLADEDGPINENLFLDEDLEGLDDELNDLNVDDMDSSDEENTQNTDN